MKTPWVLWYFFKTLKGTWDSLVWEPMTYSTTLLAKTISYHTYAEFMLFLGRYCLTSMCSPVSKAHYILFPPTIWRKSGIRSEVWQLCFILLGWVEGWRPFRRHGKHNGWARKNGERGQPRLKPSAEGGAEPSTVRTSRGKLGRLRLLLGQAQGLLSRIRAVCAEGRHSGY